MKFNNNQIMNFKTEKLILILYVNSDIISTDKFKIGIKEIYHKIQKDNPNDYELFVLPTNELNSRLECINPVYIENKSEWNIVKNKLENIKLKLQEYESATTH